MVFLRTPPRPLNVIVIYAEIFPNKSHSRTTRGLVVIVEGRITKDLDGLPFNELQPTHAMGWAIKLFVILANIGYYHSGIALTDPWEVEEQSK